MGEIHVIGGPSHNRLPMELISEVNDCWHLILKELQKPGEHGVNNNEIKEVVNRWAQAGAAFQAAVNNLPAQGRMIEFKANSIARAVEQMGKRLPR